jgi:hypothetical protein
VDTVLHQLHDRVPTGVVFVLLDACSQEADVTARDAGDQGPGNQGLGPVKVVLKHVERCVVVGVGGRGRAENSV